jgi:hypothetical protein
MGTTISINVIWEKLFYVFSIITISTFLLISIFPLYASATPISIAAKALGWTVKRTSSLVATYAAADSIAGTSGGPGLNPGLCVNGSITGAGVSCLSSDFFAHPTPPGNDWAIASAFAMSRWIGFDTEADTHTATGKGDLAIAGAYAKGGGNIDTSGSVKFNLSLTLGRLTLTAALDPGPVSYDLIISDLNPDYLNEDIFPNLMATELQNKGYILSQPATTFYNLHLGYDDTTGILEVENESNYLYSGLLLTEDDFEIFFFTDEDPFGNIVSRPGIRLKDESKGNIILDLPGDSPNTFISVEAMQYEVAVIPEPTTMLLLGSGLIGLVGFRKKFKK